MKNALLKMHLAVFLWGFTGVLGRAITLKEYPLTWYRTLFTALLLLIILYARNEFKKLRPFEILRFAGIGSIIAIHWVAFYGSIKYANASIALTCLATAGVFTAILEPILLKSKFNPKEMGIGLVALIGMYLIYHFEFRYATGIVLGILASLLSAVFTLLNKRIVANYPPRLVAFHEIGSGFLCLTLFLPIYLYLFPESNFKVSSSDFGWLLVLSLFCTVWAQSLALSALKTLSSFTTVLMVNLEPVYGILLAIFFFKENKEFGPGFLLGILLIGASVLLHSYLMIRQRRKNERP
ncbi:MAG: EamA family transporter [Chitinophagaceae bacterium]|nr:EamA family transporter [Chitinophagaceae bacterium]